MSIQSVADGLLFPFQPQIESAPDLGLRLALDFQAHGVHLTARFAVEGRHPHPKDRFAVHELQLGGIAGDLHRLHRCRVEILRHSELEQTCNLLGTHPDLHLFYLPSPRGGRLRWPAIHATHGLDIGAGHSKTGENRQRTRKCDESHTSMVPEWRKMRETLRFRRS
nr:hypothetical protein [Bifidobacterium catenulatum]